MPARTRFFVSSAGTVKSVQEFKIKLSDNFIGDDSHVKIVWLHGAVFTKSEILRVFRCLFNKTLFGEGP